MILADQFFPGEFRDLAKFVVNICDLTGMVSDRYYRRSVDGTLKLYMGTPSTISSADVSGRNRPSAISASSPITPEVHGQ